LIESSLLKGERFRIGSRTTNTVHINTNEAISHNHIAFGICRKRSDTDSSRNFSVSAKLRYPIGVNRIRTGFESSYKSIIFYADIRAAVPEVNVTAGLRVDDPDGSALKAWVLG
jgi:hypothetical protein